jgi:hypothetical protein
LAMRFRIVFVRRPSSSCGLSYIPTKTNNAEKVTSRAHMWAHFRAWEAGRWDRGHTQVESDHLSAYKVACIGQEMDAD